MRYLHYIWDFDGTLFDSYPHTTAALCQTLAHYRRPVDPILANRLLRTSFAATFSTLELDEEQQQYFRALHADLTLPPVIVPFPHAKEVLEKLCQDGARHYLYTHSKPRMSVAFIERFGMAELFDDYMTPVSPGFAAKPDPGAIRYLMAKHAMTPDETVMVGDRELDMLSARAAGIDGILIDPDRLVDKTCAVIRIDDLDELKAALPHR